MASVDGEAPNLFISVILIAYIIAGSYQLIQCSKWSYTWFITKVAEEQESAYKGGRFVQYCSSGGCMSYWKKHPAKPEGKNDK